MWKILIAPLCLAGSISIAQGFAACPDLNGHYQWKQIFATADLVVEQNACASVHVHLVADALGDKTVKDVQTPLDGVTRINPNSEPGTREYVSAKFIGDVANVRIDDDLLDEQGHVTGHQHQLITSQLNGPNKLEVKMVTLDDNGQPTDSNDFEFTRITKFTTTVRD